MLLRTDFDHSKGRMHAQNFTVLMLLLNRVMRNFTILILLLSGSETFFSISVAARCAYVYLRSCIEGGAKMEEALIEQLVGLYLTRGGSVFIVPQYSVAGEHSCPDFVGLDFKKPEIFVAEVTKAGSPANAIAKAKDRHKQWFEPLRAELDARGIGVGKRSPDQTNTWL